MKKVYFLLVCLLIVAACKKPVDPSKYAYSFIANGTQYVGNTYIANYVGDSSFGAWFFEGDPKDSLFVGLNFTHNGYIDTGTYTNVGPLFFYNNGYYYHEEYGTYSITKLDTANHLISGTFQFRCTNSLMTVLDVNVMSGVFTNIQYGVH